MPAPGTSAKQTLIEELRDYYEQFENINEDAAELSATLNDAQFNWRPSPKRWSISECLSHLNTADRLDVPALQEAIERPRRRHHRESAVPLRFSEQKLRPVFRTAGQVPIQGAESLFAGIQPPQGESGPRIHLDSRATPGVGDEIERPGPGAHQDADCLPACELQSWSALRAFGRA
jgi:hypothetical protein